MKQQIVIIHGGDTFNTYKEYLKFLKGWKIDFDNIKKKRTDWKDNLSKTLGEKFEVIAPKMPNKLNAKYLEWKIWFEKFIPHFNSRVILIGHSLGGIFLAKYLSENRSPKKIIALFLVSAPFDEKDTPYPLGDFKLPKSLEKINQQVKKIFIYQSTDDPVVPFADFKKYQAALKNLTARILKKREHITQEKFPEIIKDIRNLSK